MFSETITLATTKNDSSAADNAEVLLHYDEKAEDYTVSITGDAETALSMLIDSSVRLMKHNGIPFEYVMSAFCQTYNDEL